MPTELQPCALVTGAAHRLGARVAEFFSASGERVAIHCYQAIDDATRLAQRLTRENPEGETFVFQLDLAQPGAAESLLDELAQQGLAVRYLVNNASTWPTAAINDTSEELFDAIFAVNLRAPLQLMAACNRRGSLRAVVNMLDCRSGGAWKGRAAYLASKAGLESVTRTAAIEWAGKVRVNGVAVGPTLLAEDASSELREAVLRKMPQGRLVNPAEVADVVFHLCAGGLSSVTGAVWTVDGGRHLVT